MQDKNDHPNGDAAATIDYLTRFTAPLALTLTPEKGREEQVLITRDAEGDTRITPASEIFRPMAPEARRGVALATAHHRPLGSGPAGFGA